MDHILQLRVGQQSSSRGVARFVTSADASRLTLALAAIAFLALFLSPFSVAGSPALSARLAAAAGGIFTSKTALFVLSNVIFLLLAADCRCCFATTASACDAAASSEPGGVLDKHAHAQHHQVPVQVQVEQCAEQSSVPCSENLDDHGKQEGEDKSTKMSANTLPDDEEQLPKLELVRVGKEEEEDNSITLELEETTVDVEDEPTCETAQEVLDRLEITELNKKFDEFIRSRRIKWVKEEEACFLCCTRSELLQIRCDGN